MPSTPASPAPVAGEAVCAFIVRVEPAFDFRSAEYQQLYSRSAATVFQSPIWLHQSYVTLAPAHSARPLIICIRARADDRLVAVIPLEVRSHLGFRVASFADFGVSDYCAMIVAPEDEGQLIGDAGLRHAINAALAGVDMVSIRKIRAQDLGLFDLLGIFVRTELAFRAHATQLVPSADAWLATVMDQTQLRSLARKRRKLMAKGNLRLEVVDDPQALRDTVAAIKTLRAGRAKLAAHWNMLANRAIARFYDDIVDDGVGARGYRLTFDDVLVSAGFGVVKDGVFHLLLTGFNSDFRNYSVGLLVILDAIKDCFARGEQRFDLTIGDQPYKRAFGTMETPMWAIWSGTSFAGTALIFLLTRFPAALRLAQRLTRGARSPG